MAGHRFMWVRSLLSTQVLHRKHGVIEPIAVGAHVLQAAPQVVR